MAVGVWYNEEKTDLFVLKRRNLSMAPDWFGYLIYALFWGLPIFSVVWFAIALYRFSIAKHRIKHGRQQYSDAEMKRRKIQLIISSVLFGIVVLIALALMGLLLLAVAFM